MKKLLIFLLMMIIIPCFADTMPFYLDSIPKTAIGMYQTGDEIIIYSHPEANSHIIKKMNFSYLPQDMPDGVFALLLNDRKLGFLFVSDIGDEGWIEVIYDKFTGAKGWVRTEDRMQFLPWLSFYNLYGRKYGLRFLKDVPGELEVLKAKSEELSQEVSVIKHAKQIKLMALRGNWALVTVVDIDKIPKTGYMRWRGDDGRIYAFPNIKPN